MTASNIASVKGTLCDGQITTGKRTAHLTLLVCGTFFDFDMPYEIIPVPPFILWLKPFMSNPHSNGRSTTFACGSEFCFLAIHGFKIITGHMSKYWLNIPNVCIEQM